MPPSAILLRFGQGNVHSNCNKSNTLSFIWPTVFSSGLSGVLVDHDSFLQKNLSEYTTEMDKTFPLFLSNKPPFPSQS